MIDSLCPCCRAPVDCTPELVVHAGIQLLAHRYRALPCPTCPGMREAAREALALADVQIVALRLALSELAPDHPLLRELAAAEVAS